jgi:hypothetical protein
LLRKKRAQRREQEEREVEDGQTLLRDNIAEADRLVGESDEMLKRHRQEREADDAEEEGRD